METKKKYINFFKKKVIFKFSEKRESDQETRKRRLSDNNRKNRDHSESVEVK